MTRGNPRSNSRLRNQKGRRLGLARILRFGVARCPGDGTDGRSLVETDGEGETERVKPLPLPDVVLRQARSKERCRFRPQAISDSCDRSDGHPLRRQKQEPANDAHVPHRRSTANEGDRSPDSVEPLGERAHTHSAKVLHRLAEVLQVRG